MDNKDLYEKIKEELYEKIKEELRDEIMEKVIEAKNEMMFMCLSYKQKTLNIEKEILHKEREGIEDLIEYNDKLYNMHSGCIRNEDKIEYYGLNKIHNNQRAKICEKIDNIRDEENRNSDEIYNFKSHKIPVALPIVDSYYIN